MPGRLRERDRQCRETVRRRGFTLLELLVVLLIIALLAGYVGPRLFGEVGKAKTKTAASQMKSIANALDRYRLDTGRFPSTEAGLQALMTNQGNVTGWDGPYMSSDMPADPWGRPYVYRSPGDGGKDYDLLTLGSDGKPGGTGEDQDVVSK
ncbi:type II secretion system major pseudopilin GspG [Cupriavidus plantarum]|uniref:Type II secretion system core protein G n=1 Tax=Cupriavidus plantarum TaxID=942865 RepID=A0A316EVH3_9BURK|nr:type II secretion system major pseudopilin GspG [Cupriavidus plantarum]NYI00747.1 general secretion pathway protein G [Cupriavidus plantarum]PWK35158.1 type II secretion system protein G (GspG) [Cupriavidus plantarum]REE93603.1 type II secretion system protein G (GspG) [Cupriavidus plantarum]RLK39025.1 type II secretion system protein G (GspG) [Cupriavidus plantarum]CAG2135817.1 Type II secretion system protein G [Cupriavidus plantarum]